MKLKDIMTEEEFLRIGMQIVRLFEPNQPSDEEFMAVRLADNQPDDQFLLAAQTRNNVAETASQIFELWVTRPEGNA